MSEKWKFAGYGALFGLAVFLSDYLLEWRGRFYLPWHGADAIVFNLGRMLGVIGTATLIGFIVGFIRDRLAKRARS